VPRALALECAADHLDVVLRLRMRGAVPHLPHVFMALTGAALDEQYD